MFYIYPKVLLLAHSQASCADFFKIGSNEGSMVCYDGLDALRMSFTSFIQGV